MSLFYKPDCGRCGDFIPFHWKGDYHLFYLRRYPDEFGQGPGTPWWHIATRDFIHFDDWGEAVPRGPMDSQDAWVFTGSVMEKDGTFHIFYTGHNPEFYKTERHLQGIMHATSTDLRVWKKDPDFLFYPPSDAGYEKDDWRDPFVFRNDEAGEYWMLITARKASGPESRRGLIALAASTDLKRWEVRKPFWEPDLYHGHECPDLFRMGDWWYLVYSTYSERRVTHYRMSRSLSGQWVCPANDTFDGRAYYAAKTAGDGERRFAFAWLPVRVPEEDGGAWQWGGSLAVHELVQRPDGSLAVRMPQTIQDSFKKPVPLSPKGVLGRWQIKDEVISANSVSRFSALGLCDLPNECMIETTLTFKEGTANCGLILKADDSFDRFYQIRLEPAGRRLVFDRLPHKGEGAFVIERPLEISAGRPVKIKVLIDGTCVVVYAGDETALSCRMYDYREGALGLFVSEGEARFEKTTVRTR